MSSMGLLISKAATEQVVSCCPNLQTVRLRTGSSSLQHAPCVQPAELAGSLKALSSISSTLRQLIVSCPELTVPKDGWQALAALTQLTYLQLNCMAVALEDVLQLTERRSLKHAVLHVGEADRLGGVPFPLIGRHGLQQGASEVWCQLPAALLARVVQPSASDGTMPGAASMAGLAHPNYVAAMSALARGVIQMQRKQRQELAEAQKHAAQLQRQLTEAQESLQHQQQQQLAQPTLGD